MSDQASWTKRLESYRYSQDERMLSYKFSQELEAKFETFSNASGQKSLLIGEFDVSKEPWRNLAIKTAARKFNFKTLEKEKGDIMEYHVYKQKLSATGMSGR